MSAHFLSNYASYALSGYLHSKLLCIHFISTVVLKDFIPSPSSTVNSHLNSILHTLSNFSPTEQHITFSECIITFTTVHRSFAPLACSTPMLYVYKHV